MEAIVLSRRTTIFRRMLGRIIIASKTCQIRFQLTVRNSTIADSLKTSAAIIRIGLRRHAKIILGFPDASSLFLIRVCNTFKAKQYSSPKISNWTLPLEAMRKKSVSKINKTGWLFWKKVRNKKSPKVLSRSTLAMIESLVWESCSLKSVRTRKPIRKNTSCFPRRNWTRDRYRV